MTVNPSGYKSAHYNGSYNAKEGAVIGARVVVEGPKYADVILEQPFTTCCQNILVKPYCELTLKATWFKYLEIWTV